MNERIIRFLSVEINNIKNVAKGIVDMPFMYDKSYYSERAEILGIYGQNGSGKTAVIDALNLVKTLMSGETLPFDGINLVQGGEKESSICVYFYIGDEQERVYRYVISVEKIKENGIDKLSIKEETVSCRMLTSLDKELSYGILARSKNGSKQPFEYEEDIEELTGGDDDKRIDLTVIKRLAYKENRSFLFAKEMKELCENSENTEWHYIPVLGEYARRNLFIINQGHSGVISVDFEMPFSVRRKDSDVLDQLVVSLAEPVVFEKEKYALFCAVISEINSIISALIPGIELKVKEYGAQTTKNGNEGVRFELLSSRDGAVFPLRYESEGIKKIISILNILALMYNHPSVFVAIDELDAGVFEYLLGELLKVMDETGAGQLLFTSHNLRPLEMLDKNSILFTSSGADGRYLRINELDSGHNLREQYIRALRLGSDTGNIYSRTLKSDIRRAFYMAGEVDLDE